MNPINDPRLGCFTEADLYNMAPSRPSSGDSSKAIKALELKVKKLEAEVKRLTKVIDKAALEFFKDGSDGEAAARMLDTLKVNRGVKKKYLDGKATP